MERGSGNRLLIGVLLLTTFVAVAASSPELACRNIQALVDQGHSKDAIAAADEAMTRFGANAEIAARIRILKAQALVGTGNWQATYETVLPQLPASLKYSETAVQRLRVLGIAAFFAKNDAAEARAALEASRRLAAAHQPKLLARVLLPRISMKAYTAAEREQAARDGLRYARRDHQDDIETKIQAGMARLLGDQERFDEAITMGEKALTWAKSHHDDSLAQRVEGNLGWCYYELGDDEMAEQNLHDAISIASRMGAAGDLVLWHMQLGNIAYDREGYPAAVAEYNQALGQSRTASSRGQILADLARVALATHNYGDARTFNDGAMKAKREANDVEGVQRSRIIGAKIDLDAAHLDEARTTLESVLGEATQKSVRSRAQAALALVDVRQEQPELAKKHFQDALDTMGDSRSDIRSDERRLSFSHISAEVYEDYVDFLIKRGNSREALRVAELSRARTLAEGLNVDRDRTDEIDPESIARRAGVTALSYWIAPDRSFLFVVTAEGVKHFVLPPAKEINAKVDEYQSELASGRASIEGSRRGSELYKMLIEPAAEAIRGRRIAGRLTGFNFETLVASTPKPHYWIEDVTIETAPALQFISPAKPSARDGRLLLIGDAPQADPGFKPLPHAPEEITAIQKYFDHRTTLAGPRATPLAYAKAAPESYAYIHFVAHGVAARQRPLDSAVILGRDTSGFELYARDVMAHPLKARLVTISSCHGAGRRAFAGEGLVGLAWAFLHAGAHEVVAALWEVNDASTVRLMDAMYSAIHAGQPPADALRAAKLKLLHSNGIWRKPQYWAPFVLYSGS